MNKTKPSRLVHFGIVSTLTCLITACADKPPGCADPDTTRVAQSLLVKEVEKYVSEIKADDDKDPEGLIPAYLSSLKVELNNIVSDGYDSKTKNQSCKAKVTIGTLGGVQFGKDIAYSTQVTKDKKLGFVLEIKAVPSIVEAVNKSMKNYYIANRYVGVWKGDYVCDQVYNDADAGPNSAFAILVSVVVKPGGEMLLERRGEGGGSERLTGAISIEKRKASGFLSGNGVNPLDHWSTFFIGVFQGEKFVADGNQVFLRLRRTSDGGEVMEKTKQGRICTLKLQREKR
ncbi:MAG: hypothetical protein H6R18_302 [Proteobacteria bacterium]|nr:hypothetical protein [Pseudomonadota bacterium]